MVRHIIEVHVNDIACVSKKFVQCKFPKSKKKRIRKKWSKRDENFRLVDVHKVLVMDDKILVSSKTHEKMIKHYQLI